MLLPTRITSALVLLLITVTAGITPGMRGAGPVFGLTFQHDVGVYASCRSFIDCDGGRDVESRVRSLWDSNLQPASAEGTAPEVRTFDDLLAAAPQHEPLIRPPKLPPPAADRSDPPL